MPEPTLLHLAAFGCDHRRDACKPLTEADVPELPPAALSAIFAKLRERNAAPADAAKLLSSAEFNLDVAIELVYLTLRRLKPSLTRAAIAEHEDFEDVLAAFRVVQRRNPTLFPNVVAPRPDAPEAADPTNARSAPGGIASAPTAS